MRPVSLKWRKAPDSCFRSGGSLRGPGKKSYCQKRAVFRRGGFAGLDEEVFRPRGRLRFFEWGGRLVGELALRRDARAFGRMGVGSCEVETDLVALEIFEHTQDVGDRFHIPAAAIVKPLPCMGQVP